MKKLYFLLLLLAGCSSIPPTNIQQPMTARPAMPAPVAADGAIYHAANQQPLFEDRRARNVGDTLVITLVEKTAANTSSTNSTSKTGSAAIGVTAPTGLGVKMAAAAGSGTDTAKFAGSGASTSGNAFTGTITVTVIEVYPNGNLQVSGEKQIAINQGSEFVRFSGVVNPATILNGNTVLSTQVADARIEYKQGGDIGQSQVMGWLGKFFLSVLPF